MAEIFSQLSLNYRFDGTTDGLLKIIRNYTNADNTGNGTVILGSALCVPAAQASKFEMRVVPSGDTARITKNDFANFRTLGDTPGSVVHRITRDDADPAGTTTGSVTLAVTVRRIAFPSDAVTGNVVFNNTLTSEGDATPPPPPPPSTFYYQAFFPGADQNTGIAVLALQKEEDSGTLIVRRRLNGTNIQGVQVNTDEIIGAHMYEVNSPVPTHSVLITDVVVSQGDGQIVNNATIFTSSNETDLFRVTSNSLNDLTDVTFRVTVRRNSDGAIREVWDFQFVVESLN